MKPEDDEPTDEELREAAALAAALEKPAGLATLGATAAPADALETAALLRHAGAPLAVPPAHEPIATAQAAPVLDARRARRRRRVARWVVTSLVAPAVAAAFLLVRPTSQRSPVPFTPTVLPAPSARLLTAQAEAARGGGSAGAALARLDLEMRAYRRQYHEGLRRRGGNP